MIELFVNSTRIELQEDAELALTFQAKDIESPDTFQSTFSINFNIPATPNNIKTFNFSDDLNVNTRFPYVFQGIRLFYFGTEIIPFGALYLLRYTNNYRGLGSFECRLFSGSLALFDAIEGKYLSDLDLSAINHNRDIATINASIANTYIDGYTYGIVQSGLTGSTTNPSDRDLAPMLFYRYVFEQIITQAGFTVSYRLFDNVSIFNEMLMPYTNEIEPRLATLYILNERLDLYAGKIGNQVINTQLAGLDFQDNTTPPFFEGTDNPFNGQSYTPTVQGVIVNIEANLQIDATLSGVNRNIELVIYDTILMAERVISTYEVTSGGLITISVNKQVQIGFLGFTTYVRLRVGNKIFNAGQSITLLQASSLKITVVDSAEVPTLWEVSRHVPKITQKDFLKDALFRFGLLPQKDQFQNSVVVSQLDYLATLGFDDWSDKLDFTNSSITQYYPDGWYQTSVYQLNDDDTIEPQNTQSYELNLNDVKLPFRGEVWNSPFGSNGVFIQSPFEIPEIKRYKLKENAIDENESFAGIYSIARYELYDKQNINPRLVQRTSDNFTCVVLNSNVFLAATTIVFKALINPESQFEVQWLSNILTDCKKLIIDGYLTSLDVFEIDFSKPKYLKQFNSFFYLNKVNQWRGQDKPSELEFFKINQDFGIPTIPQNLTATADSDSIVLDWDFSLFADGYIIERSTVSGSGFVEIATVNNLTNTYDDTTALIGVTYYYRVKAFNSSGDSAYSNEASAMIVVLSYALAFDGVNDYLQNNVSTPFTQWFSNQPTTSVYIFKSNSLSSFQTLIDARSNANEGSLAYILNGNEFYWELLTNSTSNGIRVFANIGAYSNQEMFITVTYDGSKNANGVKIYKNGILLTTNISINTMVQNSIVRPVCRIGYKNPNLTTSSLSYFIGLIQEISVVNYAKNLTEINADIAAGTQLAGSGSFLFRLPLIYKNNGTGNIATLDSTVPIPELAQSLNMNYLGYPNPLVLNTNLIQI